MEQSVLNIILAAVSIVVTGLASWGVAVFTNWISSKMKDKKAAKMLSDIIRIITDAVMEIFQTFVEALKKEGKFDAAAQQMAKEKAMEKIMTRLGEDMKQYISDNYGDIKAWISDQIETIIYQLKNK